MSVVYDAGDRFVLVKELISHSARELQVFANKYANAIYVEDGYESVCEVIDNMECLGYDYDIALSLVRTPSSYQ